jgi:hypothetical protein
MPRMVAADSFCGGSGFRPKREKRALSYDASRVSGRFLPAGKDPSKLVRWLLNQPGSELSGQQACSNDPGYEQSAVDGPVPMAKSEQDYGEMKEIEAVRNGA